ncbi:MAG: pyridine nucleotide-disulfide oxidoreductase [Bacillales bacterium]|jgi:NADH dehydrogenase|nr:pyridine nucleotide-disulfide oxidoreductase [Bacillales bacterium]
MRKPKIVLLGAGYVGMMTASHLQKKLETSEAEITLVNKHEYHYQSTWLHESAAGTVSDDQTVMKISDIIDFNKVNFVKDVVVEIKPDEQKVILENGVLEYDYLVIGLGFEAETFGIEGLKEYAYSITTINACNKIRNKIEENLIKYKETGDEKLLSIIVGGAGFTGMEFIAELGHKVPQLCEKHNIDRNSVKIICVEAMQNALPGFADDLIEYAVRSLESKGIEFRLSNVVKKCTETSIIVENNGEQEEIEAGIVIWAAGIRGSRIVADSPIQNNRGRILVDEFLRAPEYNNIFVAGDCSLVLDPETGRPYPPTAQIAIQQSYPLADNLITLVRGNNKLKAFKFAPKGTVCSLGFDDGVGVVYGVKLSGWKAALMKKVIDNRYLFLLGGVPLVLKKGKFKFI